MVETLVKRISKKGKRKALNKWNKILRRTISGKNLSNPRGFFCLKINTECNYCIELDNDMNECNGCSLYENKICDTERNDETLFWKYMDEMFKHFSNIQTVDRQKAIGYAKEIRDFIKNDPTKDED